jgi:hypothetical protein
MSSFRSPSRRHEAGVELGVAVNIDASDLLDPSLPEDVQDCPSVTRSRRIVWSWR